MVKILTILIISNGISNIATSEDDLLERGAYLVTQSMEKMVNDKLITYTEYGLIIDKIETININNRLFLSALCEIETTNKGICDLTITALIQASKLHFPNDYICALRDYVSKDSKNDFKCKSV